MPYADVNLLELPPGDEHETDFTMQSDIFPTGWHGVELSGMRPATGSPCSGAGRSG